MCPRKPFQYQLLFIIHYIPREQNMTLIGFEQNRSVSVSMRKMPSGCSITQVHMGIHSVNFRSSKKDNMAKRPGQIVSLNFVLTETNPVEIACTFRGCL